VHPLGLVDKDDVWYLVAGTDGGQRTFRVDRIAAAQTTDEPAVRPADFDLAASWRGVVEVVEQRRSLLVADVLADPRRVDVLAGHLGRHCEVVGPTPDGRVALRVSAQSARAVAEQLAGWVGTAEVTGPPEVQAELAAIGAELVRVYA
jgi:predicted DNA-binding transcriptional regulator YafY